jgi:nitroimidazol reductase NimA-like FMN-containing flavoprotein (pyridoxamine 5'-phosphate oxidase superfamily)
VTEVPRGLSSLVTRRGGSALANARTAMESLGAVVAERAELMRLLLHDDRPDAHPGDLIALSRDACLELLRTRTVGRLAYVARASVPDVVPVNYVMVGEDVLIRSGPGPKLQAAERRDVVAFEVDEIDEVAHRGWSVVVHGTARRLSAAETGRLPVDARPWAVGPRSHVIRVRPQRITGRRLG